MESRARIQRRQDTKEKKRQKSVNLTRTPNYSQQKSFPERETFSHGVGGMGKSKENGTPRATCWIALCTTTTSPWERRQFERTALTQKTVLSAGVGRGTKGTTDLISKQKAKNRLPQKPREKIIFHFQEGGERQENFWDSPPKLVIYFWRFSRS